MPRTAYLLLALAICFPSLAAAQAGKGESGVHACVAALSKALSARLGADDYPTDLQKDGTQGTALVQLTIGHDGRVRQTALAQTSGSTALDRAAVKGVERVFPRGSATPSECQLEAESLVTLPIRFQLQTVPRK
jgi:periplasmic protein TonB